MKYSFRAMVKEDLDQVNEIDHEAFPTQWPPANYKQELQNKIAYYLVACDTTRTVPSSPKTEKRHTGITTLLMPWKKEKAIVLPPSAAPQCVIAGFSGIWMMAGEAHVTNLAVKREYRGQGLGEYLLLATYDMAQAQNATFMTLEVRASNIVAQALYNKFGFMEMGVRKGYYLDNHEDAMIMSTEMLNSRVYQDKIQKLRENLHKKFGG